MTSKTPGLDRRRFCAAAAARGGHFAAWEQPKAFCEEIRTCFRSLRT